MILYYTVCSYTCCLGEVTLSIQVQCTNGTWDARTDDGLQSTPSNVIDRRD